MVNKRGNEMYFILIINSFLMIFEVVSGEECKMVDYCTCQTSKGRVDLHPLLEGSAQNPRFSTNDGNYNYYYEPCQSVVKSVCGDNSKSACQKQSFGSEVVFDIGQADSASFSGDPEQNSLVLNYHAADNQRKSAVKLVCSNAAEKPDFKFDGESPQGSGNFLFTLQSKYACVVPITPSPASHKISAGSVMLIIFFLLLGLYFIGGIIFMKFVQGAQGVEMVPNHGFWTSLPGYIKDGVQFTCQGCKTQSSYSKI